VTRDVSGPSSEISSERAVGAVEPSRPTANRWVTPGTARCISRMDWRERRPQRLLTCRGPRGARAASCA
jgi:hypothetical protein